MRFGVSGGINTSVYVVSGKLLIDAGVGHAATGCLALLMASLSGYLLHRHFSFRSENDAQGDIVRFGTLVALNSSFSSLALPWLVKVGGLPDVLALCAVSVVLPLTNYLAMRTWVFSRKAKAERR